MKNKQTMFFALLGDIENILKKIESVKQINYHITGLIDFESIKSYDSYFNIPHIGLTKFGDWNRIDNYLLMSANEELKIEKIPPWSDQCGSFHVIECL